MTNPISHDVLINILYHHYGIHLYTLLPALTIITYSFIFCINVIELLKELYIYENNVILIVPGITVISLTIMLAFQLIRFINSILMSKY